MNISNQIFKIRKKANLSQDKFAKIFNVTKQSVSNWETEKNLPDIQIIVQISNYFGITLDELLKG